MKIEQAKALKVGEFAIRLTESSEFFTKGDAYEVLNVGELINLRDRLGSAHGMDSQWLGANFDLPPVATNTQWVPFDKERMSEAEGYRVNDGSNDLVTEVAAVGDSIAFLLDGKFGHCSIASQVIDMLVPVVVAYPCLMMVIDCDGGSSLQKITGTDGLSYIGDCGTIYSSARAPTTAELAEINLQVIK